MRTVLLLALAALTTTAQQRASSYSIETVAGSDPIRDGRPAISALLANPADVAADRHGNLYIADAANRRLRRVTPDGVITTLVHDRVPAPAFGAENSALLAAQLFSPSAVAVDAEGNVYVADSGNICVRKVTPDGAVTTVAGNGRPGFAGDGGPAVTAEFRSLNGLALDAAGNLYIADQANNRIRKVSLDGTITTVAGNGQRGFSGDGGPAVEAQLGAAADVGVDAVGNLYIADPVNQRIRKVSPDGIISTVAGSGQRASGGDGGPASEAQLNLPGGVAVDAAGNLYIADSSNFRIRRVTADGIITTVAGSGTPGFSGDGGPAEQAQIGLLRGIATDVDGALLIADAANQRIRRVSAGTIATIAGASHLQGDGGPATSAVLFAPAGVAFDSAGNLYIADTSNHAIRRVARDSTISTIAGTGEGGFSGDGGPATAARLLLPSGVAVDRDGNIWVADTGNHRIRRISSGRIETVAGTGFPGFGGDGAPAPQAQLLSPRAVAVDAAGTLYIADTGNDRVRAVARDGAIRTVAGSAQRGFAGDGGPAVQAAMSVPGALALDARGNLYISDVNNRRIRRVGPDGIITTVAGSGLGLPGDDSGPAVNAALGTVFGIAVDESGALYLAESGGAFTAFQPPLHRVRRVNAAGIIATIAGAGAAGFEGDGGPALAARFDAPNGIAVDASGSIYIADASNHRIRRLLPNLPARLLVLAGEAQAGPAGTRLPDPFAVRVLGTGGFGVPDVAVQFRVISGPALLAAAPSASELTVFTDSSGTASANAMLGAMAGPAAVEASVAGLPSVRFTATSLAAPPAAARPQIAAIVGAALSVPPVREISPGGLATIFGRNFAAEGTSTTAGWADRRVPRRVAGVCVQVGTELAPILYASSNQINFQAPNVAVPSEATVQVISNCGSLQAAASEPQRVAARQASPELFYTARTPAGRNYVAAFNETTRQLVGPVAVRPGDIVSLFGTGFGPTLPPIVPGELPSEQARLAERLTVRLGSVEAREIFYAGPAPGLPGVSQIVCRIPADAPEGDLALTITTGAFMTPAGAYLAVGR
jgi:uncharacterized protein (TIGR03437 family)